MIPTHLLPWTISDEIFHCVKCKPKKKEIQNDTCNLQCGQFSRPKSGQILISLLWKTNRSRAKSKLEIEVDYKWSKNSLVKKIQLSFRLFNSGFKKQEGLVGTKEALAFCAAKPRPRRRRITKDKCKNGWISISYIPGCDIIFSESVDIAAIAGPIIAKQSTRLERTLLALHTKRPSLRSIPSADAPLLFLFPFFSQLETKVPEKVIQNRGKN